MKKSPLRIFALLLLAGVITACGGSVNYADGNYEGKSSLYENPDDPEAGNGYGVVNIVIKDKAITECTFKSYEPDGTLKGEDYGKKSGGVSNRDFYNKAQKAVAACDEYAKQLISSGNIDDIDAISGATINHDQFVEAVKEALKSAEAK